jgi:RecB family exonuclease
MHDTLEHIHLQAIKGYNVKEEEIGDIVEDFWNDVSGSKETNLKIKNAVIRYLKNYIRNFQNLLKTAYMVEKEFWVFFEEGVFTGRIDLIRKNEEGEFEIVDFKIGLVPGFDYEEQLKTYLLGVRLGLNLDITKAMIHVLKPTKSGIYTSPIRFSFTKEEIENTKRTILETINNINNEYFEPTPSHEKCLKCELTEYDLCPFAKTNADALR